LDLVPALVLETLDLKPISRAVRQPPGNYETGNAFIRSRERQKHVGMRDREEPLVPNQRISSIGVPGRAGLGLTQVRAALLFRHGHADRAAALLGRRQRTGVVFSRRNEVAEVRPASGIALQDRNSRIGHAERAADAVFPLVPKVGHHGARNLSALARLRPAERMKFVAHGERHKLVPGRMKLDLIDPAAPAIMRAQFRRMAVGKSGQFLNERRSDALSDCLSVRFRPFSLESFKNIDERRIGGKCIVIGHCRRLVQDLMSRVSARIKRKHSAGPPFNFIRSFHGGYVQRP
jgi:hypothetical protein